MNYFDSEKHPDRKTPQRPGDQADLDGDVPDISKKDWEEGDRVLAPWGQSTLYPGTVGEVRETKVYVYYDDGDRCWAPKDQVRALQIIAAGSRISCRWRGGSSYDPGRIVRMKGDQIFVQYDDGEYEWTTLAMMSIPSGLPPTFFEYIPSWFGFLLIGLILAIAFRFATRK